MLGEIFFDADSRILSYRIIDPTIDVSAMHQKHDGKVFIGTWTHGLFEARLSGQSITIEKVEAIEDRGAINQIISYHNQYLLATDYGIAILQNQDFVAPYQNLSMGFIQDIEYDKSNGLMYFTDGNNVFRIDNSTLNADLVFSSSGYTIIQLLPDDGYLWLADDKGMLRKVFNGRVVKTIDLSAYGASIYHLIFDDNNNIWLCQDNLLGVIQVKQEQYIKVYGPAQGLRGKVNFIKTTPYLQLLMGTNDPDNYLLYYDQLNDSIISMEGSAHGASQQSLSVNDLVFDDNKVLWLATNQGLYKRKGTIMEKISLETQSEIDVKAIAIDRDDNIWFASSTGIFKYDRKNIIPFSHTDGLPGKTITYRNVVTDTYNRVWAGTVAGVAYSPNNQLPLISAKPRLISITERGIPLNDFTSGKFTNQSYLAFSFVSAEYPVSAVSYQVKMSGKDEDWKVISGRNEVFYSDFDKGDYTFMVRARHRGNYLWSPPLSYHFSIHTIWYQSWITWVAFSLVFILAVFQLTKWRNRRLEVEKVKLNRQVLERTQKLEKTSHEIEAKNKQLIIAKEEAERSSRAKADFLSTMSHEIRTPLNGVLGMINILLLEEPREDQLDKISTMKFSAENLLSLINDILDFNKIDEGKLKLENIEFSLHELAYNLKAGFMPQAKSKNINFVLELDSELPEYIVGDPTRLAQVLNNLLGNAVKFTEKGEVKLMIKSQELKNGNVEIVFSVIDTGIGIAPEQLQNIFDSFSQASSDTTRKYGGSGLGLAITKKLLEIMNSKITVKSKMGFGSEFTFRIQTKAVARIEKAKPLAEEARQPAEHGINKSKSKAQSLAGLKILLVEDNLINTRIARQILEKWDIRVDHAQDGQIAVNKFKPGKYDLILMDLHMPNMDGYDATRAIREKDTEIPIVALTAAVKIQDKDKVLEAGMNEFVSKPFKPAELHQLIKKLTLEDAGFEDAVKMPRPDFESLRGYRVLLVEDNDINIKIASQFLVKWDIEVDVAKDGQIAIDMFKPDKYHLILMDLHLPNVDGYEATKAIRQMDKNIPIIALTAAAMVQEKQKVLAEGMNDFISKPFKPRDLYNKITNSVMNATFNAG
jgi:signal transduction histidine kinase/CheY-like chemotaxis protein